MIRTLRWPARAARRLLVMLVLAAAAMAVLPFSGFAASLHDHVVADGEVIEELAECFDTTPTAIGALQPGRFPTEESLDAIWAGEVLVMPEVPATHIVGSKITSLSELERCYDLPAGTLVERQPHRFPDEASWTLVPGERLVILAPPQRPVERAPPAEILPPAQSAPPASDAPGVHGTTVVVIAIGAIVALVLIEVLLRRVRAADRARATREVPPEVRRAALIMGLAIGTGILCLGFLGLMISRIAADLDTSEGRVTGAVALGSAVVAAVTVTTIARRPGVPPRWHTVGGFALAALGLLGVAFAPNVAWVYAGAVLGVLPLTVLNLIRPALARRFRADNLDGSFTSEARAWSYAVLTAGSLAIGATASAFPAGGWRIATGGLALYVAGVALVLALWRDLPRRRAQADAAQGLPAPARMSFAELWRIVRVGELRRSLLALCCSVVILQIVWLSLEPWLAEVGLGAGAALAVGAIGMARLVAVRWILAYGELSDHRVRRASTLAAAWLLVSGALALVTIAPIGSLAATLVVAVVAVTTVEIGSGTLNNSARTYVTRLASEADLVATLAGAAAAYLGAQLAALLSWQQSVPVWATMALIAVLVTRQRRLSPTGFRVDVVMATHLVARLKLSREGEGNARVRLLLRLGGVAHSTVAREGSVLLVDTPATGDAGSPRSRVFKVRFDWRTRPRRVRRRSGLLFPYARFPMVLEGRRFGTGIWQGWFGRWSVEDGTVRLRSRELARPLRAELFELAA